MASASLLGGNDMRIPDTKNLVRYIRQLIQEDKLELFYQTNLWKELRQEVLAELHYECQECMKRGRYSRADCVHHVNEVRHRPDLALSKYFIDKDNNKHRNLLPLCNTCHNIVHDKLGNWQRKDRFMNEERW